MRLVDIEQVYCSDCEEKGVCEKVTCDVKKMPTIEAVPVVRCKDCKYMEITEETGDRYCHVWGFFNGAGDDGFCNYGKRRDDQP